MILDLHSHLPAPKSSAIISCMPGELPAADAFPQQLYSVGVHPWQVDAGNMGEASFDSIIAAAQRRDVVAIGECGIDLSHSGAAPLFEQLLTLKSHIKLSESLHLPLIIHCVKAWDHIIALRKEFTPGQRWIIHGFRGKPQVLEMLLKAGIDVSYGENFNPQSVALTPIEHLFAETDESSLPIEEIIDRLARYNPAVNSATIAANISTLLVGPES